MITAEEHRSGATANCTETAANAFINAAAHERGVPGPLSHDRGPAGRRPTSFFGGFSECDAIISAHLGTPIGSRRPPRFFLCLFDNTKTRRLPQRDFCDFLQRHRLHRNDSSHSRWFLGYFDGLSDMSVQFPIATVVTVTIDASFVHTPQFRAVTVSVERSNLTIG